MTKLYQEIASRLQAIENCRKSGNTDWLNRHECHLDHIERNHLPSGSGVDSGTRIERMPRSNRNRIVLSCSFHHMNETGHYDGWTNHEIIITPSFNGFDMRITGRNRNDIKDYLGDLFHTALMQDTTLDMLVDCP